MDKKYQENTCTEDDDYQRMTVQLIGVALKNRPAHINGGVSGCMAAEKEQQHQP